MLNIVLYEPEIPPNTGNLIRLCANSGARLHLIEPLGFSMNTKALRRAGLDYHEAAEVRRWPTIDACWTSLGAISTSAGQSAERTVGIPAEWPAEWPTERPKDSPTGGPVGTRFPRTWAATTRGDTLHTDITYREGDILLFGPESRGLPDPVLEDDRVTSWIRIPMRAGSRSLNLSNAVSIVLYEAWRQLSFAGSETTAASRAQVHSDAPSPRAGHTGHRS